MTKIAMLFMSLLLYVFNTRAQKPVIDTSLFRTYPNKWPRISQGKISHDGKYVLYSIDDSGCDCPQIVLSSTDGSWKQPIQGARAAQFSVDSKWVVFQQGVDSLCIWRLGTKDREYIGGVEMRGRINLNKRGDGVRLAYTKKGKEQELVLRDLQSGKERRYLGVSDYSLSDDGKVLLLEKGNREESGGTHQVFWINTASGAEQEIWQGSRVREFVYNEQQDGVCFYSEDSVAGREDRRLWYYGPGDKSARVMAQPGRRGIDTALNLFRDLPVFSHDGRRIFFKLVERELPPTLPGLALVDVWNYKDKYEKGSDLLGVGPAIFLSVVNIDNGKIIPLQHEDEWIIDNLSKWNDAVQLVVVGGGDPKEWMWNPPRNRPYLYLQSTIDGSRQLIKTNVTGNPCTNNLSPDGHWFVYYDNQSGQYCSYDRQEEKMHLLTGALKTDWSEDVVGSSNGTPSPGLLGPFPEMAGIGGWVGAGDRVLIYDRYDIWELDPSGKLPPRNITRGYGKAHHIRFRLLDQRDGEHILRPQDQLLLTAFNEDTKDHGFFRQQLDGKEGPEQLVMGPWSYESVIKAQDKDEWLMIRMGSNEYRNYWVSSDMRQYQPVSELAPQRAYNWMITELAHWKREDGKTMTGILYRPENFDAKKRYPAILTYYDQLSYRLNEFVTPEAAYGPLNIAYFVSRGYVVFVPDIAYTIGETGESALKCVESAAHYLMTKPWIDGKRMGIEGCSFGGFETNYVVTHSHLFAAACEASGPADLISTYGELFGGCGGYGGESVKYLFEQGQLRIGANPWQRQDLYIKNSPILKADKVTTPLLMMHNLNDGNVQFEQAVELFTGLRRLGKKAWLLQYDRGTHALAFLPDAIDFTIRLEQFFDHYLKGAPPPVWMTEGVPARLKGIQTGLGLDTSGRIP